jgi:uncharacterized protein
MGKSSGKTRIPSVITREKAVGLLRSHLREIQNFGVRRLALFGSVARNQARRNSDLDLLVDFDEATFKRYMGLKSYLETLFDRKVDLLTPPALEPRLKSNIIKDMVDVSND